MPRKGCKALKGILFLCVNNSCRSQMAEALARSYAPESVNIYSAGTNPTSINPRVPEVMSEVGIAVTGQYSKSIDEIPVDLIDIYITLCGDKDSCPTIPGATHEHWPFDDPAQATGDDENILSAFRKVREDIDKRVRTLFGK